MKRILFALVLATASIPALAVDVSITLTAGHANRFAAACGEIRQLKDTQEPPQPRDCTPAEAKEFIIMLMRRVVVDVEGAKLIKQAVDAVIVPAFDPT